MIAQRWIDRVIGFTPFHQRHAQCGVMFRRHFHTKAETIQQLRAQCAFFRVHGADERATTVVLK